MPFRRGGVRADLWTSLRALDWNDPRVAGIVVVITVLALIRKWSFVLLLALVIALAQGLQYLLGHAGISPEFAHGAVIGVYAFGGILLLFLAIAHFLTKS
jgi:hypothetical protein